MNTLDLSTLDTSAKAETGFSVDITHPVTGEPLGISVTLAGKDSQTYRKAQAAQYRKAIGRGKREVTPEEVRGSASRLLATCTLAWTGVTLDNEVLSCSAENAATIYQRFPWFYEQVDEAIHDRANCLRD